MMEKLIENPGNEEGNMTEIYMSLREIKSLAIGLKDWLKKK